MHARRSGRSLQGIVGSAVSAAVARHGHTRASLDIAHLGDSAARPASGRQEHHLIAHAHPVGWSRSVEIRFFKHSTKYDRRFHRGRSSGIAVVQGARFVELKPDGFPGHPPCTAAEGAPDATVARCDPREIEDAPSDRAGAILGAPHGSPLRGFLGRGSRPVPLPVRLPRRALLGSAAPHLAAAVGPIRRHDRAASLAEFPEVRPAARRLRGLALELAGARAASRSSIAAPGLDVLALRGAAFRDRRARHRASGQARRGDRRAAEPTATRSSGASTFAAARSFPSTAPASARSRKGGPVHVGDAGRRGAPAGGPRPPGKVPPSLRGFFDPPSLISG